MLPNRELNVAITSSHVSSHAGRRNILESADALGYELKSWDVPGAYPRATAIRNIVRKLINPACSTVHIHRPKNYVSSKEKFPERLIPGVDGTCGTNVFLSSTTAVVRETEKVCTKIRQRTSQGLRELRRRGSIPRVCTTLVRRMRVRECQYPISYLAGFGRKI